MIHRISRPLIALSTAASLIAASGALRADTYARQPGIDARHYAVRLTLLTTDSNDVQAEADVTLRIVTAGTREATLDLTSATPDGKGMTVTKIEARIIHHLPGVDPHRYEKILTPGNGLLDEYTLTFDSPPSGELGWGYYTVNVQVTVQASGGATYVSDWWPQVTSH